MVHGGVLQRAERALGGLSAEPQGASGYRRADRYERGAVETYGRVATCVARGKIFLTFHFPDMRTSFLTSGHSDPTVRCPEYKVTAVAVKRTGPARKDAPLIAAGFRQDAHD